MKKNILTYNPDYIIVLIGVNNRWNLIGRSWEISDDLQIKAGNRILISINNLRLVKLVKLIVVNIKYKLFWHSIFSTQKDNIVNSNNKSKEDENSLGSEELQQEISKIQQEVAKNNISEAFIKARKLSEKYTDNAGIHALLARIYCLQYNYEKCIEEYNKALALEPNNISFLHGKAVSYRESGNMKKALDLFGVIAKIEPQNKFFKMDFRQTFLNYKGKWALFGQEERIMDYWLKRDLTDIALILLKYQKRLIFLTYPTLNWQDEIRKEISRSFNVPLVDIYSTFKRLNNISEYLGETGGHPNDKGYYIMARMVFNQARF
ncbi:MAG: tetratricopeptide repeat protein [Candidatus Omnitrophica bacterium]|nr:tetratricopeptide repeat protein [Candidatus Omnitrophota bacterium]